MNWVKWFVEAVVAGAAEAERVRARDEARKRRDEMKAAVAYLHLHDETFLLRCGWSRIPSGGAHVHEWWSPPPGWPKEGPYEHGHAVNSTKFWLRDGWPMHSHCGYHKPANFGLPAGIGRGRL